MHGGGFGGMHAGGFRGGAMAFGGGARFGGPGFGGARFGGARFAGGPFAAHAAIGPHFAGGARFHNGHFIGRHAFFFRHNRFNRFAFFGGPFDYDYANYYDDGCFRQTWTRYGWQWVNVCGDSW
jgi:hypothetical protein